MRAKPEVQSKRVQRRGAVSQPERAERKGRPGDEALALFARVQQRVGTTPQQRLAWATRVIQKPQKDFTPGDWDNLRAELTAFALGPAFPPLSLPSSYRDMLKAIGEQRRAKNPAPWDRPGDFPLHEEEAKACLARMGTMIQAAVKRDMVIVGRGKLRALGWIQTYGKWLPLPADTTWPDQTASALGDLLERAGHLLKECPAPLPREEQTCGVWFVASRPRQEYCTAACQSRASTRASRAGTSTPAALKRAEVDKEN